MVDWLGYAAAISGFIGAATGIAAYKKANQIKSRDWRIDLRRAECDLRTTVEELPHLMQTALGSHENIANVTGELKTGSFEAWKREWEIDSAAVDALTAAKPDTANDHAGVTDPELESRLIAVHGLASQATRLRDKYRGSLARDERERDIRRETVARLGRGAAP
jgi:hypothetical protein